MIESIVSWYQTGSFILFGLVLALVLVNDVLERCEVLGFRQDTKFGSSVTGIMWPITLMLVCSTLPWVNLVWVAIIAVIVYNKFNEK